MPENSDRHVAARLAYQSGESREVEVLYPDEVLRPQLLENDAREELVDAPVALPLLEAELAAPDEVVRERPETPIGESVVGAGDIALREPDQPQSEARIIDADNAEGTDWITFSCDLSGRYNPFPMVEPVVRETKFC